MKNLSRLNADLEQFFYNHGDRKELVAIMVEGDLISFSADWWVEFPTPDSPGFLTGVSANPILPTSKQVGNDEFSRIEKKARAFARSEEGCDMILNEILRKHDLQDCVI